MAVLLHLHRELLKDIVILIQSSPSPVTFYKVKSHSGILAMRVQTTKHTKQQSIKFLTFLSRQLLTPSTTCFG